MAEAAWNFSWIEDVDSRLYPGKMVILSESINLKQEFKSFGENTELNSITFQYSTFSFSYIAK